MLVTAPATATWEALVAYVSRTHLGIGSGFAALVGAEHRAVRGELPEEGAAFPGFAVTESVPGKCLTLAGRHRFSRYALGFVLTGDARGTVLAARSYGVFPGLTGRTYRTLVIGLGPHRLLVRRMLRDVARIAQRRDPRQRAPHPGG
ncbi:hypothetical protein [Streptomyces sp. NPDC089919]|uniref:hypothetical protein n=1 Tax=Streptomyces sp. NPDC089919 TaxID=3155188 RepID=UPI003437708A